MTRKKTENGTDRKPVFGLLRGVVFASLASLGLIALFALLLQKQVLGFDSVRYINPGVKAVCAVLAGFIGTKRAEKRSWLLGAGCGLCYIVLTTVVFSLLAGGFSLGTGNLVDCAMCAFAGMAGGMLRSFTRR